MHSQTLVCGMIHVLGAIPGAQKIEAAHKEAVTALDRFCLAMKTRKQGAPFPDGEPEASAAQRPTDPVPEIDRLKAENASLRSMATALGKQCAELERDRDYNAELLAAAEQRAEAAEKERDEANEIATALGKQCTELERDRDYNAALRDDSIRAWRAAEELAAAAEQRNTALMVMLRKYGQHSKVCLLETHHTNTRCDCGFDAALIAALPAALHDEERSAPGRAEPPAGPSDSLSKTAAQGEEK